LVVVGDGATATLVGGSSGGDAAHIDAARAVRGLGAGHKASKAPAGASGAGGAARRIMIGSSPRGGAEVAEVVATTTVGAVAASRARALVADRCCRKAKGESPCVAGAGAGGAVAVGATGTRGPEAGGRCAVTAAVAAARTRSATVGLGKRERGGRVAWAPSRCASSSQGKRKACPQSGHVRPLTRKKKKTQEKNNNDEKIKNAFNNENVNVH
jgi:hypothetical protein